MNILLLDDHPIFRFGVRQLIQAHWPDSGISEAGSLAEALTTLRRAPCRLALADLNLPDCHGLEAVIQLHRAFPDLPLLVLSLNEEAAYARHALRAGASGYLTKDRAADELIAALERLAGGGRYITASLAEHLADILTGQETQSGHEMLSSQEYRVMLLLAQGTRLTDIAQTMHLSPKTVSTYRTRILEKLALANNAELTAYCLGRHLIAPPM